MHTLHCRGRLLVLDKPKIMGIINTTPDSFYAGSRVADPGNLLRHAEKMIGDGSDILDIGGQSTRPGAVAISEEEELRRVVSAIGILHARFPEIPVSVDTFRSRVAAEAIAAGASIINDISGGADPDMFALAGRLSVPYICMHIKGDWQTMIRQAHYEDVVAEVLDFLIKKIAECRKAGIHDIIIDPGFGFAKTPHHNFALLKNLAVFSTLGQPLLLGLSRKSTIYKPLGIGPEEALNGTTVLNTLGLLNGASILRVHDPKEAKEAIRLMDLYSLA